MSTDTAKLAKCVCRYSDVLQSSPRGNLTCVVYCSNCGAKTPPFMSQSLADAAWNRMMAVPETCEQFNARMEPLRAAAGISTPTGSEDWAKDFQCETACKLLSALADELMRRSAFESITFTGVNKAIRAVLANKP